MEITDLDLQRIEWRNQAKHFDRLAEHQDNLAEQNREAGFDGAASQYDEQAENYRAEARALRDQAHPGKRCWEVQSGRASWHQRKAGHVFASSIRFMKTETELADYLKKLRDRDEPYCCKEITRLSDPMGGGSLIPARLPVPHTGKRWGANP